jgi:hypothetical protein
MAIRSYVTAVQLHVDKVLVYWEHSHIANITEYRVYRRISEHEDWEQIATTTPTVRSYEDALQIHHAQTIYYKVEAVASGVEELGQDDTYGWRPDGLRDSLYWLLKEEVRRIDFGLRQVAEEAIVALKKWLGTPCPRCFSPDMASAADPSCPDCYGTGWLGGYDYVRTRALVGSLPTLQFRGSDFGVAVDSRPRVWLLPNPPILFPFTYLVRNDGQVYILNGVQHKRIQGKMVYQSAQLQLVSANDPVYLWAKHHEAEILQAIGQ